MSMTMYDLKALHSCIQEVLTAQTHSKGIRCIVKPDYNARHTRK